MIEAIGALLQRYPASVTSKSCLNYSFYSADLLYEFLNYHGPFSAVAKRGNIVKPAEWSRDLIFANEIPTYKPLQLSVYRAPTFNTGGLLPVRASACSRCARTYYARVLKSGVGVYLLET